jgi:hypothetical protein
VRYFYNATRFVALVHSWNNCGSCYEGPDAHSKRWRGRHSLRMGDDQGSNLLTTTGAVGGDWKLNRRCPDRCDPDGPLDDCREGFQWCLNSSSIVVRRQLDRPVAVRCFTADEMHRAKVSIGKFTRRSLNCAFDAFAFMIATIVWQRRMPAIEP